MEEHILEVTLLLVLAQLVGRQCSRCGEMETVEMVVSVNVLTYRCRVCGLATPPLPMPARGELQMLRLIGIVE